jgi:hypothetical protein
LIYTKERVCGDIWDTQRKNRSLLRPRCRLVAHPGTEETLFRVPNPATCPVCEEVETKKSLNLTLRFGKYEIHASDYFWSEKCEGISTPRGLNSLIGN